ncbi:MAG: hypothetical protein M1522_01560 [Actinobacteria bacterium]|nr:hypothetical protein [Actinomycetota bacterium]
MRTSERLLGRLRLMGMVVPDGSTLHRTYAGRCQRQCDAWSWFILDPEGREVCGGYVPVAELLQQRLVVLVGLVGAPEVATLDVVAGQRYIGASKMLYSEAGTP